MSKCNLSHRVTPRTDLQLVAPALEWPAMREVVLRMPRAGGTTPSSAWVRGTELARVETRRRSGWSSLRLRRRWLRLGSLKLRPLSRPIRLWLTTSSKRSRCFLGMKILANMVGRGKNRGREKSSSAPFVLVTAGKDNSYFSTSGQHHPHWSFTGKTPKKSSISDATQPKNLNSQAIHRPKSCKWWRDSCSVVHCSSCRMHLIGAKIVQSMSSHGKAEAGRRDGPALVCVHVYLKETSFVFVVLSH